MARKETVVMTDDLNGEEDDSVRTREFAVDGVTYEIDLDEDNSAEFDDLLAVYIENGRRTGGRKQQGRRSSTGTATIDREQSRTIRAWAHHNGYELAERGRIPARVVDAYNAAQSGRGPLAAAS